MKNRKKILDKCTPHRLAQWRFAAAKRMQKQLRDEAHSRELQREFDMGKTA